ncbi:MAG: hypothetical protein BalsKO_27380 [Balneolaceae bacterium]
MNKNTLLSVIITVLCLSTAINAQTKEDPTWVSVFIGQNDYNGDFGNELFQFEFPNDFTAGFGVHHYLNSSFDINFNSSFGTLDNDDPTAFWVNFWNNNLQAKYKLANGKLFAENSKIKPFATLGLGVTSFTKGTNYLNPDRDIRNNVSVQIPFGFGFEVPLSNDLDFIFQTTYNRTFNDYIDERTEDNGNSFVDDRNHDDFLTHTIGIKYNLFKKKDADGDGVRDNKDLCVNQAGPEQTMGCPDGDMDLIADKDDQCPETAGLSQFNGCADTDRDGIADYDDACPEISGEAKYSGCKDTDADGIADPEDQCPNIAGLISTGGCPDGDADGIIDSKDLCPKVAGPSEKNGCPDTDNDGVLDKDDDCPNEVGAPGNNGCPGISEEVQEQLDVIFQNLLFGSNSSVIDPSSLDDLDNLATIMSNDETLKLSIEGHTDSQGRAEYNLSLSQLRADAVKAYLIEKSIDENRITAIGYGETKPIDTNETAEGRNKNRRVVLDLSYE